MGNVAVMNGSIADGWIVAGTDYAHHVETAIDRALHRMNLFARQEQHVARADSGLRVLRPHHALAPKNDQHLFIQMPMRLGLRTRNVANELRDVRRTVVPVDEDLEEPLG